MNRYCIDFNCDCHLLIATINCLSTLVEIRTKCDFFFLMLIYSEFHTIDDWIFVVVVYMLRQKKWWIIPRGNRIKLICQRDWATTTTTKVALTPWLYCNRRSEVILCHRMSSVHRFMLCSFIVVFHIYWWSIREFYRVRRYYFHELFGSLKLLLPVKCQFIKWNNFFFLISCEKNIGLLVELHWCIVNWILFTLNFNCSLTAPIVSRCKRTPFDLILRWYTQDFGYICKRWRKKKSYNQLNWSRLDIAYYVKCLLRSSPDLDGFVRVKGIFVY